MEYKKYLDYIKEKYRYFEEKYIQFGFYGYLPLN